MKIVLGSNNQEKVRILEKALKQLHLKARIESVKTATKITDPPLNKDTTLNRAKKMAKNAKKGKRDADYWIGIESGLHDYGEGYHLVTYACLVNKDNSEFIGEGTEIHLPEAVSDKIKKESRFGDAVRMYAKVNKINKNLVSHETPFVEAIQRAYANYLKANNKLGIRKKSIAFVFNEDKEFLLVQLQIYGPEHWNMPGGGIDEEEDAQSAIKRELKEELGTDKFEIVEVSKVKSQYDWPDFVIADRIVKKKQYFKGQEQTQFLVKFTGDKNEIKIQEEEIRKYKWVKYKDLEEHLIFPNQWENAKNVIENSSITP